MASLSDKTQLRTYLRATSVVFRKTNEEFGGLSNMAAGFPLEVNGLAIRTAEALYQACRFPHRPDLQRHIIDQRSPMTAKMVGKPHRADSRGDWDRVRVAIMRWTLRVKLAQNWSAFGELLLATGERPIVEDSRRDDFWGAMRVDSQTLAGVNVLGRLLMELREELREHGTALLTVEPPALGDFLLNGRPIEGIRATGAPPRPVLEDHPTEEESRQPSLFDGRPPAAPEESRPMLPNLPPYPAYRDSGVPWLAEVPEHWELRRLKTLLVERSERGHADEPLLAATQTKGVVRKEEYENRTVLAQKDLHLLKLVLPDDFVISLRSFQGGIEYAHERGIISPAYTVLYPHDRANHRYLAVLFKSKPFIENLTLFVTGIRQGQNIDYDRLSRSPIPLPPPDEQVAIVRFLDHADRRIRRYIRAKQRLIALLEEQKQAIIHRAVTRGLDPNARLKPSGVEWLGDIPKHWELHRLKDLVLRIDQGVSPQAEAVLAGPGEWGVLKAGCANRGEFRETEHKRLPDGYSFAPELAVKPGDVIVSRASGSPALVGSVARVKELTYQVILSDKTFRPLWKVPNTVDFFVYVMNSRIWREQVEQAISGAEGLANNLPLSELRSFSLPVPPEEEATAITRRLDSDLSELQHALAIGRTHLHLLTEYRARLIADIVTGKLDVREAAARLPEEMDEPDPLEDLDLPDDELDDLDTGEVEAELAEATT